MTNIREKIIGTGIVVVLLLIEFILLGVFKCK